MLVPERQVGKGGDEGFSLHLFFNFQLSTYKGGQKDFFEPTCNFWHLSDPYWSFFILVFVFKYELILTDWSPHSLTAAFSSTIPKGGISTTPLYLKPLYYIFNIVTVTGIMNISTGGAQLTSWPYRYKIIENHTSLLSPFSLQALNAVNLISQYQEDTGTKVTFVWFLFVFFCAVIWHDQENIILNISLFWICFISAFWAER